MKKPGIPSVPKPDDDRTRFDQSLKESLEVIMGRRSTPISPVSVIPIASAATTEDCANKVNEVVLALNALLKVVQ